VKKLYLLPLVAMLGSLTSCGSSKRVLIYTTAEEEKIRFMQEKLDEKFPDYDVVIQYIGNGKLVSKLLAEGKKTSCDIIYELEVLNSERVIAEHEDLFYDLKDDYDLSIYDDSALEYASRHTKYAINQKSYGAVLVNNKVLKEKGVEAPTKYTDLLDAKYKGLIEMPDPNSSGTGYSIYNGLVSYYGETEGIKYFADLKGNVKEFTTSGSTPLKDVEAGNVGIGFGMLWQCVEYTNKEGNDDLSVVVLDNKAPYTYYTMAMINHDEIRPEVKEVFNYFYTELNQMQVAKFVPNKIYKDQAAPTIPNYPQNVESVEMKHVFDYEYKLHLLDKWVA